MRARRWSYCHKPFTVGPRSPGPVLAQRPREGETVFPNGCNSLLRTHSGCSERSAAKSMQTLVFPVLRFPPRHSQCWRHSELCRGFYGTRFPLQCDAGSFCQLLKLWDLSFASQFSEVFLRRRVGQPLGPGNPPSGPPALRGSLPQRVGRTQGLYSREYNRTIALGCHF